MTAAVTAVDSESEMVTEAAANAAATMATAVDTEEEMATEAMAAAMAAAAVKEETVVVQKVVAKAAAEMADLENGGFERSSLCSRRSSHWWGLRANRWHLLGNLKLSRECSLGRHALQLSFQTGVQRKLSSHRLRCLHTH